MSVAAILLAAAGACTAASPAHTVAVVELYTSQGCSSCPPADRWLSGLGAALPAERAIPLALHVGYWDYIGWKDPFAKRAFNARQTQLAAANRSRSVYTPGVFVQGREVPDWHVPRVFRDQLAAINARPAPATVELGARFDGSAVDVDVRTRGPVREPRLVVALAQDGLDTRVTAGENRGERLANDRVVREWYEHRGSTTTLRVPLPAGATPGQLTLVAWVQEGDGAAPLQAVSLPLARCAR